MKAYSYIRFSSDKQKWGDSERRQEQLAKDFCTRKGIQLADTYADRGVSGWKGKNRQTGNFARLLEVVKSGDYILIEDNDRFSREDCLTAMVALKDVVNQGVKIVFLQTGQEVNKDNFNDPSILFTNFMRAYLANSETTKKSTRIGEKWAQKKQHARDTKEVITRSLPGWVKVDAKTNKPIEDIPKADLVRRIFKSIADGTPLRTVVRLLNKENVQPFGRLGQNHGNGWSATHMRRILTSRSVLGEYQPHKFDADKNLREPEGEPIPDYYPRTIDLVTFHKAQSKLEHNKGLGPGPGAKQNATNLFTGLAKCACCGKSMWVKEESKQRKYVYTYLICSRAVRGKGCDYHTISCQHVERAVLSVVWSIVIPKLKEASSNESQLQAARGELKHLEKTIANLNSGLLEIAASGGTNPKSIIASIGNLETEADTLKANIEKWEAIGNTNGLLDWEPLEQSVENRLRLQSILRNTIKSLHIDAGERKATLEVNLDADNTMTFQLSWDKGNGANQTKKNPADSYFYAMGEKLTYTDQHFVWKSVLTWNPETEISILNINPEVTEFTPADV